MSLRVIYEVEFLDQLKYSAPWSYLASYLGSGLSVRSPPDFLLRRTEPRKYHWDMQLQLIIFSLPHPPFRPILVPEEGEETYAAQSNAIHQSLVKNPTRCKLQT